MCHEGPCSVGRRRTCRWMGGRSLWQVFGRTDKGMALVCGWLRVAQRGLCVARARLCMQQRGPQSCCPRKSRKDAAGFGGCRCVRRCRAGQGPWMQRRRRRCGTASDTLRKHNRSRGGGGCWPQSGSRLLAAQLASLRACLGCCSTVGRVSAMPLGTRSWSRASREAALAARIVRGVSIR